MGVTLAVTVRGLPVYGWARVALSKVTVARAWVMVKVPVTWWPPGTLGSSSTRPGPLSSAATG